MNYPSIMTNVHCSNRKSLKQTHFQKHQLDVSQENFKSQKKKDQLRIPSFSIRYSRKRRFQKITISVISPLDYLNLPSLYTGYRNLTNITFKERCMAGCQDVKLNIPSKVLDTILARVKDFQKHCIMAYLTSSVNQMLIRQNSKDIFQNL